MTLCAAMLISVGALPDSKSVAEIKRQILQRSDLTGKPGTVVVVSRVELKPGASVPLHTHPGDEFLHILDGGVVNVPGKPPIVFKDGQTVHFPRGKVHGGFTVAGTKSIKAITVHIVDKHAPISKPYKK